MLVDLRQSHSILAENESQCDHEFHLGELLANAGPEAVAERDKRAAHRLMNTSIFQSGTPEPFHFVIFREVTLGVSFVPSLGVEQCGIGSPVFLGIVQAIGVEADGDVGRNGVGFVVVRDVERSVRSGFRDAYDRRIQPECFKLEKRLLVRNERETTYDDNGMNMTYHDTQRGHQFGEYRAVVPFRRIKRLVTGRFLYPVE